MVLPSLNAAKTAKSSTSKHALLIAKLVISAALIGWLLRGVDLHVLLSDMTSIGGAPLGAALLLVILQIAAGAFRWHLIVSRLGGRLTTARSLAAFYIGVFCNCFLPSSVGGDVVRGWQAHRDGLPLTVAINSVLLDRISTLLGLMVVVLVMIVPLFALLGPPAAVFLLLAAGALGGCAFIMLLDRLPAGLSSWKIVAGLRALSQDCRRIFLDVRNLLEIVGLSCLVAILMALTIYALALGLALPILLQDCLLLVPPVILVTALPISIGGWGLREASFVFAFSFIGIPASAALSLSVLYGLVSLAGALPGSAFWVFGRRGLTPTADSQA